MRMLKFIMCILGAIMLSVPIWFALLLLGGEHPRILAFLIASLAVAYLYWPGKKHGLFLEVLGPVLLLELLLLLTINLIIL